MFEGFETQRIAAADVDRVLEAFQLWVDRARAGDIGWLHVRARKP